MSEYKPNEKLRELALSMASFIAAIDSSSSDVAEYIERRLSPLIELMEIDAKVEEVIDRCGWDGRTLEAMRIGAPVRKLKHCPAGLEEKSRELHREYQLLAKAQEAGADNRADVIRVTDECNRLGIILVPNGENL